MDWIDTLLKIVLGLLGLLLCPYGLVCLILALRHRQPGIDLGWTFKTRLAAANFDDRGRRLRQRGINALIAWVVVFGALVVIAMSQARRR